VTQENQPQQGEKQSYQPPAGISRAQRMALGERELAYQAQGDWIVLRKDDDPVAEIFHVAYLVDGAPAESRPITFVFNGGPGASSAYLHVGALGPRCIAFGERGEVLAPPVRLIDNQETWLAFTDLVFVDPVGTGFSRVVDARKPGQPGAEGKADKPPNQEFFALNRDLDSLGEFIQRFLSRHHRWTSPVFIAGESYGGFRAAKLARRLQQGFGIGLNGAILISPALEWTLLIPSDYDTLHFVDTFPTMVATAHHHQRCSALSSELPVERILAAAEAFAARELSGLLVAGERIPETSRRETLERMAALVGVPAELLIRCGGRLRIEKFARELLRDQGRICGLYDTSATAHDPYPDRDVCEGPDPTLFAIERVFASGINAQLRTTIGLDTERDYRLLSFDVNKFWKLDTEQHVFERNVGATDDLRYAMSLNPHMRILVSHGLYDLITPYFAAERLLGHMKLNAEQRARLTTRHFSGGHMFYTWDASRVDFRDTAQSFFRSAT
jgi:carboxypeptidase C (cathepsin A)